MQKQGSTMLKVTSILLIVFGALGLLTDLFLIVGLSEEGLWTMADRYGYSMSTLNLAFVFLVLAVVIELVAGIVGVNSWYKKEKAGVCIGLGWIILILIALGVIFEIIFFSKLKALYPRGTFEGFSVGLAVIGLAAMIVPLLYLIGAYKLKNMEFQPINYNAYYNNGYNAYGNQAYNNQGFTGQQSYGQGYTNQGYTGQQNYANQGYTNQGYPNQGYAGQQNYTNQNYMNPGYTNQGYTNQNYTGQTAASQSNTTPLYPWQAGYTAPDSNAGTQAPADTDNQ